jgi:phosphate transport system substrate-binding protein
MAALQNKAGKYVMPSEKSGAEALAKAAIPEDMIVWLPDPEGEGSYPIATYTWMIFFKKYDDPKKAEAIKKLITYCLTEGQKFSAKMGYIPLPENVVQAVKKAAENIK